MSCKSQHSHFRDLATFTDMSLAAVARKFSVATMTIPMMSPRSLQTLTLVNVLSDAKLDSLLSVPSLAAPSNHACSSPARSRFGSVKLL
jgi:hypothetical protein